MNIVKYRNNVAETRPAICSIRSLAITCLHELNSPKMCNKLRVIH